MTDGSFMKIATSQPEAIEMGGLAKELSVMLLVRFL